MILGAIEIGLRSTHLTVSEVGPRSSQRLLARDHLLKAELGNLQRLGALIMAEAECARDAGAEQVEVVAAPELRGTRLIRLAGRFAEATGAGPIRLPSRRERVASAFLGATRGLPSRDDRIGLATIDEDAIGIAVGSPGEIPDWIGTRPVGTAVMTRRARFFDPPLPTQLEAAITGATRAITSLSPPDTERLLVGSRLAAVVTRLGGPRPGSHDSRRGLDAILGQTGDDIAAWFGIGTVLARQLPGVLVGHVALAEGLNREIEPVSSDQVAGRYWLKRDPATVGGRTGEPSW
ncbi:MAG: hypothetical protein M9938_07840 [Solirubrobacterales bacterium]|nr:hypothetical protein [Solirubrobacterales bacterium]